MAESKIEIKPATDAKSEKPGLRIEAPEFAHIKAVADELQTTPSMALKFLVRLGARSIGRPT